MAGMSNAYGIFTVLSAVLKVLDTLPKPSLTD
jgi:hypothetical protein